MDVSHPLPAVLSEPSRRRDLDEYRGCGTRGLCAPSSSINGLPTLGGAGSLWRVGTTMLINFVYCHPVGHAVEALHYANGYHLADPDRRICMALIATTATELTTFAGFVDATYPVPVDVFAPADHTATLAGIPSTWDWVVSDARSVDPVQRGIFPGLAAYHDASASHFTGARGLAGHRPPPSYVPGAHLRLDIPPAPFGTTPRIAILPGGSAPRHLYPSVRSWELIVDALARRFPGATFCLVGKLREDGRTSTTLGRAEFDRLRSAMPRVHDVVDAPLTDQLAAVAACDVLVSPHSGFGMAALAAGTPWLTIGGNRWPEYFFNGVPFYTVLPDVERFPCYTLMAEDPPPVEDDGPRSPSMSRERILADLDEIVDGAARLVERRWDYETALYDHARRMLALRGGDPTMVWSLDNVLVKALS